MKSESPLVSVLIPVKNGKSFIGKCLDSIITQTFTKFEIIVIDNGSTDATKSVCARYRTRYFTRLGKLADIRKFGVTKARGEYLAFVDADQYLSSTVLAEGVALCKSGKKAVVFRERSAYSTYIAQVFSLERQISEDAGRGLPRFFNKKFYESLGGHSAGIMFGEDFDLLTKMQTRDIGMTNSFIYHHDILSFLTLFQKYVAYGKGLNNFYEANSKGMFVSKSRMFAQQVLRSFLRSPVKTILVIFIKLVKFVALQYGHLSAKK